MRDCEGSRLPLEADRKERYNGHGVFVVVPRGSFRELEVWRGLPLSRARIFRDRLCMIFSFSLINSLKEVVQFGFTSIEIALLHASFNTGYFKMKFRVSNDGIFVLSTAETLFLWACWLSS
ncbi:hypothetical protein Cni_G11399 [Canna indica]|uniref:Uncharacterized protein n=1 Tax=Canna indica TaxID=4628 RepID=A0AAQ3K697_9LILI|nr:hypothetical protein Cni_G11399 [Canna indica]